MENADNYGYEKTKKVIQSCRTFSHLFGARQYAVLYIRTLPNYLLIPISKDLQRRLDYQIQYIKSKY